MQLAHILFHFIAFAFVLIRAAIDIGEFLVFYWENKTFMEVLLQFMASLIVIWN